MYDYGFEEYNEFTVSDFTWVLYRMICEIRCIESFMRKNQDYIPCDAYSEEATSKTLQWMHDRGILNGMFNSFFYDNPQAIVWTVCAVVETVENLLKYMERAYPEAIKVFVLGK